MGGDADNWVRKVSGKLREFIPKALPGTGRGEHQEDAGGWSERTVCGHFTFERCNPASGMKGALRGAEQCCSCFVN